MQVQSSQRRINEICDSQGSELRGSAFEKMRTRWGEGFRYDDFERKDKKGALSTKSSSQTKSIYAYIPHCCTTIRWLAAPVTVRSAHVIPWIYSILANIVVICAIEIPSCDVQGDPLLCFSPEAGRHNVQG